VSYIKTNTPYFIFFTETDKALHLLFYSP